MATVWLALRADVRRRWAALLSLAVLLGLIGGVVLTAAAGARRTDTAYPRLLTWANASQVGIVPENTGFTGYYRALARLPHIAAMTTVSIYNVVLSPRNPAMVNLMSSPDGAMGVSVDRVKILAGRPYDPKAPGQAMVDQQMASTEHLTPGSTLRLYGVPSAPSGAPEYSKAVTLTFRVTAIVVFDDEIVPTGTNNTLRTAVVSSPFTATTAAANLSGGDEAAVRLQPGASQTAFTSAAEALAKRYPGTGGNIIPLPLSDQVNATERAIRPEAIALVVFAGLAGLIALAVIGQLLSRQLALDAAEFPVLRALGVQRAALVTLSLARLGIVTVTGAIVAVAVAIAASPLMPIGPARLAEPHPGVEVNLAILGAGFAAIALLPLAVLIPPAWRAARQAQGPLGLADPTDRQSRPSRLAAALTHAGSVTGGAGVAMAFEPGHGRTAVPVRSALAGSIIAVAALAAAAVFGASLIGLVSTPRDYGQNWVQEVDFNFGTSSPAQGAQMAHAITGLDGYAAGNYGQLTIDGKIVPAIGLDQVRGGGYLTLLAGRAPTAPDEIAVGAQTLRAIGASLGQTITVTVNQDTTGGPGPAHRMRVVGIGVLPAFSRGSFAPTGLGAGAVVAASVLSAGARESTTDSPCTPGGLCYNFFLLRYKPGADLAAEAAMITKVLTANGCPVGSCIVPAVADQRPGDIKNYASIRDTPLALAVVLAVLAIGTLAHVLLTGVRRRRRDLALLKTLGFTRRQVLGTVAWEASAFAAVALLVGLPLGVVAGRWAWALFANAAGVSAAATVPLATVLLAVPATLLAANLIAAVPGWEAARLRPALVLRTELPEQMATVWLELRADLRQRWRPLLSLALLLGLIGGVVLTAAGGARRTDTAFPRLLSWANASQVDIVPAGNGYVGDYYAALAKLPQVAKLSTAVLYQVVLPTAKHADNNQVTAMSSPDRTFGVTVDRAKVVAGRPFDPAATGQAMIDSQLAALEHVGPGGTLHLVGVPNDPKTGSPDWAKRVPLAFRVTAVVVFDTQVVPIGGGSGSGNVEPTALVSSFPVPGAATTMSYGNEAAIRLRPGATVDSLSRAATALAKRYPDTNGQILTVSQATQQAATQQAIRPQAIALAAFAALAGLITLVVIGQLLSRQLALDSAEFPVLRAIGATRASLVALSLARLAIVTLSGGVLAVAVAIAASPLMPIGPARLAEPHPGVEVNLAILAPGFAAIALLPLALLAGAAWRAARAAGGPLGVAEPVQQERRSRIGGALTRAGSVTGGVGVAMAFEPGRGRTAVPVRSALAGSVIAVAALTAAAAFGTSLVALISTPHDYGQNWDAQLDAEFGGVPGPLGARVIAAEPAVTGYASGNYGQLLIDGQVVPAIGLDQPAGGGYLTMLAGSPPGAPDEIALGAQTLRAIHAHVGDTISVTAEQVAAGIPAVHREMRVTGVTVLPAFGRGTFTPTGLGTGAVTTASVLSVLLVPDATTLCRTKATCYNFFLLRYRPGTDTSAAAATLIASVTRASCPPGSCAVTADQRPSDIKDYASVRDTPLVLAAALIVFAVGTLAHVLLTGVRRRRRDLALLKTLGFARSQVLGVVAWEATAFAVVALLIGLPLGVLAGRWAWAYFANAAGAPAGATIPLTAVLLAVPVTLVLANLIAAWPGWTAARLRPALVLRTE